MERIFVDTSGWYSLVDRKDPDHKKAASFFAKNRFPLVTSNFIFCETLNLTKKRLGQEIAVKLGQKMQQSKITQIIEIENELKENAWQIFQKYDDRGFSFTDCTSFALMRRLKIANAFTFDNHFAQFGFMMLPEKHMFS